MSNDDLKKASAEIQKGLINTKEEMKYAKR